MWLVPILPTCPTLNALFSLAATAVAAPSPVEAFYSAETVPQICTDDKMIRLQHLAVLVLAAGIVQGSPSPLLGGLGGGDSAGGAGDKLGGGAFPFVVSYFFFN